MPCRDYESDTWDYSSENRKLKAQADRLARIACKAMDALEEMGKEDFLLLKDDEVATWWKAHKEADRKERERVAEQERRERVRAEALAKLSSEERELLGLAKSKKKSAKKSADEDEVVMIAVDDLVDKLNSNMPDWEDEEIDLGAGLKVRVIR